MTQAFGQNLERQALGASRRTGTVIDVTDVPNTISVTLGDDGTDPDTAIDLPYLDTYTPSVNDSVTVLATSVGDHIVLGRVSELNTPPRSSWIRATLNPTTSMTLLNQQWTELRYEVATSGGDPNIGQLSITPAGKILIPRAGLWVITPSVLFPVATYVRTLVGSNTVGIGNANNGTRGEVWGVSGGVTHYNTAHAYPVEYAANALVTGYAYQSSGGSVVITGTDSRLVGYQVG